MTFHQLTLSTEADLAVNERPCNTRKPQPQPSWSLEHICIDVVITITTTTESEREQVMRRREIGENIHSEYRLKSRVYLRDIGLAITKLTMVADVSSRGYFRLMKSS